MEYLEAMKETYPLESLSEFLVMAATLLRIKSKMLIPVETTEEGEDPRDELVRRLVEYKMYKYAAGELKDLSVDADKVFYKHETVPEEIRNYVEPVDPGELLSDVTLDKLNAVFHMVMRKSKDRVDPVRSRFGKIRKERYKVEDRMVEIHNMIKGLKKISFRALLESKPDREIIVVTFLAVLEMMKAGQVTVSQDNNFGEIYLDAAD
jgi:segregation and condensation protein A